MTPEHVTARLRRRGPIEWSELSQLVLADIWNRMTVYRSANGIPMPPDHLRPALAEPALPTGGTHQ